MKPFTPIKRLFLAVGIFVFVVVAGVILLVSNYTTYLNSSGLPRGFIMRWHTDGPITSGEVRSLLSFLAVHASNQAFVKVGHFVIQDPEWLVPYVLPIKGTPYAFAVSRHDGRPIMYLIDKKTATARRIKFELSHLRGADNVLTFPPIEIYPIEQGQYSIVNFGHTIGSTFRGDKIEGKLTGDGKQLVISELQYGELTELTIDLEPLEVVHIKVTESEARKERRAAKERGK